MIPTTMPAIQPISVIRKPATAAVAGGRLHDPYPWHRTWLACAGWLEARRPPPTVERPGRRRPGGTAPVAANGDGMPQAR